MSARHTGAQPLDSATIPLDNDIAISGVAFDAKEFAEGDRQIAVLDGQSSDLGDGFAEEPIRSDALGLEGNRCRTAIAEAEHR